MKNMKTEKEIRETVKAAMLNNGEAQYWLASWFYEKEILASACYWFERAGQQGHLESMLMFKRLTKKLGNPS